MGGGGQSLAARWRLQKDWLSCIHNTSITPTCSDLTPILPSPRVLAAAIIMPVCEDTVLRRDEPVLRSNYPLVYVTGILYSERETTAFTDI